MFVKPIIVSTRQKINEKEKTRNAIIQSFGKEGRWKDIMALYKKESKDYNSVNYATTMTQLGRISKYRPVDTQNPTFLDYMDDLARKIENRSLKRFEIRHIADVINAIAKLRLRSNDNAERIIKFTAKPENANAIISQGNPQEISIICWGMSKYGDLKSFSSFYSLVESELDRLLSDKDLDPQSASNLAYACAKMGVQSPKLLKVIENNSTWLVENGTTQAISNTAWACATLGNPSPNLFAGIEKHSNSTWLVENGNPQDIANTAWACATLGIQSPNLFANIEKHADWLVENGNSQGISNTALAFATQGIPSKEFFGALMNSLDTFLDEANNQDIINVCYSIAILDLAKKYKEEFLRLWSNALGLDPRHVTVEDWTQLAQSYVFVTAAGMKVQRPKIPTGVDLAANVSESKSQADVSRTLTAIGFQHKQEVSPFVITGNKQSSTLLPKDMLAIDCACPKRKIAIEYDGPSHFLIKLPSGETSNIENGSTRAKRRFLKRLGWKVYNIRYTDWDKAKGKKEKEALLNSMLKS